MKDRDWRTLTCSSDGVPLPPQLATNGSMRTRRLFWRALVGLAGLLILSTSEATDLNCEAWPIAFRVSEGDFDEVKVCLDQGYEPTAQALTIAATHGLVEITDLLLRHGAPLDTEDAWGRSLLTEVAEDGLTDVVKALIAHGADFNHQDDYGYTALIVAAEEGHTETVLALLDAGADPEIQYYIHANLNGTPLVAAAESGHPEVVRVLLERGANVNAVGPSCQTALFWPTYNGLDSPSRPNDFHEVAELLVTHGAFTNLIGWTSAHFYFSPLQLARESGDTRLKEILEKGVVLERSPREDCRIDEEPAKREEKLKTTIRFVAPSTVGGGVSHVPISEIVPGEVFFVEVTAPGDGASTREVELSWHGKSIKATAHRKQPGDLPGDGVFLAGPFVVPPDFLARPAPPDEGGVPGAKATRRSE